MAEWQWVVLRLPRMPRFRTERQLRKLRKKDLAARCWAADVNSDDARYVASEWAANATQLADMLRGRRPVDTELLDRIDEHRAHVEKCRTGSCEHEYAALLRSEAVMNPPSVAEEK